jgi:glutamate 5-kinase
VGVLGVRGTFRAGDAVRLLDPDGTELGRGLARCAAEDAARVAGRSRDELSPLEREIDVVIHRDDMAIWK